MGFMTLLSIAVDHAFYGPGGGCPPVDLALLDAGLAARHRLVVHAKPGHLRVVAEADSRGRPHFGPRRPCSVDLALIARDSIVETITQWPARSRTAAPDTLGGVRRRSMPMWIRGERDEGLVPVFPTRGHVRWTPSGDQASEVEVRHADGRLAARRGQPAGCRIEQILAAPKPSGHWSVVIDGVEHHLYTGSLPDRCIGLVRVDLPPGAEGVYAAVSLPTRSVVWTYRIISRESGPVSGATPPYAIVYAGSSLPVPSFGQPKRWRRTGFEISSDHPLPLRANPIGPLQLKRTDTHSVLVERLPTPSPRALRAEINVYL